MGSITPLTAAVLAVASVLLAWPAVASGATPVRKDFYGEGPNKTSFQVINRDGRRAVRYFSIQLASGCNANGGITAGMRTTRVTKSGRFARTVRLGSAIYQRFSGRFTSPRRATGTFRTRTSIGSLCDTGTQRWTAKAMDRTPVRDGAWRGAVASGSPLSFSVSNGGRVLSKIQGAAPSNCTTSSLAFEEMSKRAIIAPDGSFQTPLSLGLGFFGGRFTGETAATGTLNAVFRSRAGVSECLSGIVPWAAAR
jgi:hypothetical protein